MNSSFSRAKPVTRVTATKPPKHRQVPGYEYPEKRFAAQSITISTSWGLQPASATIIYPDNGIGPVTIGQDLHIECCGHHFWGRCKNDMPVNGTSGRIRTLEFVDYRDDLAECDDCFGVFNKEEDTIVGGEKIRRYFSILPRDAETGIKTYKQGTGYQPFTAAEIINFMLAAPTTESPWRVFHCDPVTGIQRPGHHPALVQLPSYDIDCSTGKKLGNAIQEVCDQHGILFTIIGGPYNLTFGRKGEGVLPNIPAASNERRDGVALSRVPTRVRVVGGNNLYQLHGIEMIPDWAEGWQEFFDFIKFQEYVFQNFASQAEIRSVPAGTPYKAIVGDIEQSVGRQLAQARALEMTVREFSEHRQKIFGDGSRFSDWRKFTGRPRMELPVALYIRNILFRAFRLSDGFVFRNASGRLIDIRSIEIVPQMVAAVSHDPVTGEMFWDTTKPSDGGGYAIVQGYQLGEDGFKTIRPDRFNLDEWTDAQNVWQHIPFEIDDSGSPDGRFIVFSEPIIRSADLFTRGDSPDEQSEFNGYAGLKANPTFTIPPVRAALCFKAERFIHTAGHGARDAAVNIPALHERFIGATNTWVRKAYHDGKTAAMKANEVALSYLSRQFGYRLGGHRNILLRNSSGTFDPGTQLNGMIDRVTVRQDPREGYIEEVDYTAERSWATFVADRDFERISRDRELFPGQKQLIEQANQSRLVAAALRGSPKTAVSMADALHGRTKLVTVDVANDVIKLGTPVWKRPNIESAGKNLNTVCSALSSDNGYRQFVGATLVHNESPGIVRVSDDREILVRVKGPVSIQQSVGKPEEEDADYLIAGSRLTVGAALQKIESDEIKLIWVRLGVTAAASGLVKLTFITEYDDFLICWNSEQENIYVAKPSNLRSSYWNPGWSAGESTKGVSIGMGRNLYRWAFRYSAPNERVKLIFPIGALGNGPLSIPNVLNGVDGKDLPPYSVDFIATREAIDPPYERPVSGVQSGETTHHVGFIYAMRFDEPVMMTPAGIPGVPADQPVYYLDINLDARHWVDTRIVRSDVIMVGDKTVYETKPQSNNQSVDNPFWNNKIDEY